MSDIMHILNLFQTYVQIRRSDHSGMIGPEEINPKVTDLNCLILIPCKNKRCKRIVVRAMMIQGNKLLACSLGPWSGFNRWCISNWRYCIYLVPQALSKLFKKYIWDYNWKGLAETRFFLIKEWFQETKWKQQARKQGGKCINIFARNPILLDTTKPEILSSI